MIEWRYAPILIGGGSSSLILGGDVEVGFMRDNVLLTTTQSVLICVISGYLFFVLKQRTKIQSVIVKKEPILT